MKWQVEVQVVGEEGKWHGNGKEFNEVEDAVTYAKDLHARWTQTICWRVVSEEEPQQEYVPSSYPRVSPFTGKTIV